MTTKEALDLLAVWLPHGRTLTWPEFRALRDEAQNVHETNFEICARLAGVSILGVGPYHKALLGRIQVRRDELAQDAAITVSGGLTPGAPARRVRVSGGCLLKTTPIHPPSTHDRAEGYREAARRLRDALAAMLEEVRP